MIISNHKKTAKYLFITAILPLAGILLFFVPYVNGILYSLHGGVGWLILMLCGPFTLMRLAWGVLYAKDPRLSLLVATAYFLLYVITTGLLAWPASRRIERVLGIQFQGHGFCVWCTLNIPWSLVYSGTPCRPEEQRL